MRRDTLQRLRENVQKAFFGHRKSVDLLLVGLLARGHVLIEDMPGVGKTVLARALARSIDCKFSRIQLTPDLLPSDVLGVSVFNQQTQTFDFKPGPIFANVVLADEINRTTPRTQSALLEAMAEEQVSWENQTIALKRPASPARSWRIGLSARAICRMGRSTRRRRSWPRYWIRCLFRRRRLLPRRVDLFRRRHV